MSLDVEILDFLFRDFDTLSVSSFVHPSFDSQPCFCLRRCDEIYDDLVRQQRLATPIHADKREQAMLDLVPLAGSRWEVANRYLQTSCI